MIKTQYINLNMVPSGVMPVLYCSQYDIGRPLGLVVYNGPEPVTLGTYVCTIEATRTDGTAITSAVTTSENIGAFVTTATMTNKADKYLAKLVLFDSNSRRVASLAFVMCVTQSAMDENSEGIEEDKSLYQQYTETVQTLIAEIKKDLSGLNFYGVKSEYKSHADGDYWLVTFPKVANNGDAVEWHVGISDGTVTSPTWVTDPRTVRELSVQKKASVAVNAGYAQRQNDLIPWGSVIMDGRLLIDQLDTHTTGIDTLGIKADGTWHYYDSDVVTGAQMLADGVIQAVSGLGAIVTNGAKTSLPTQRTSGGRWQSIGYSTDNYYILTGEEGAADQTGITLDDMADIYLSLGATEAYVLDSGGSCSTNIESVKLNSNKDDQGLTDRKVATILYIKKPDVTDRPTYDEDVSIGTVIGLIASRLSAATGVLAPYKLNASGEIQDCNDLPINSVAYTYPSVTVNSPDGGYWHIFTYGYSNSIKVQLAIRHTDGAVSMRGRNGSGVWTDWQSHPAFTQVEIGSGKTITSCNDAPIGIALVNTDASDWITTSYRYVMVTLVLSGNFSWKVQLAWQEKKSGYLIYRLKGPSLGWTDWQYLARLSDLETAGVSFSADQNNTRTLADLGVIKEAGYYQVCVTRAGSNADSGSMYYIHYTGSAFEGVTTIHESALVSGPVLANTGIIKPKSSSASQSYVVRCFKIY